MQKPASGRGNNMLRVVLVTLGILGVLDTLAVMLISNFNLGVVLPGILGLPLLLLGIFLPVLPQSFKTGALPAAIFYYSYVLIFLLFAATSIRIYTASSKPPPQGADAIIVLGAGLRGDRPTLVLKRRMDTALKYLANNPKTVAVLSGGRGRDEYISEAEAMARYFKAQGLEPSRILLEDASTNTRENFAFSQELLKNRLGENLKLGFVTTDFHVYRAGRAAKKLGITAFGISAPDIWYLSLNNCLRESVAIWAYLLMGRI